jgi:hypothetical protein
MNLPYVAKLLVFCAVFYFVIHGVLGLVTYFAGPAAIRLAESAPSRLGARILLCLRLFPPAFGVLAVFVLCVPSYLLFEPRESAERLNLAASGAALCGAAIWGISIARTLRGLMRSVALLRAAGIMGETVYLSGELVPAVVLSQGPPIFAMCGIFRPQLVFSRDVQMALSPEEFDVALRHERAHRISGDNLKRVLFSLAPEVLPFSRCFTGLEDAWSNMSEWAADDDATLDDPEAAVALATALVRVARLGVQPCSLICVSLVTDTNLSGRVGRLVLDERVRVPKRTSNKPVRSTIIGIFGAGFLAATASLTLHWFLPIVHGIHRLLERLAG